MTSEKSQVHDQDGSWTEGDEKKERIQEEHEESRYTVFTKQEKRWISFLVGFAGMFSPLSSFIYYPAIYTLARDLNTSIETINLTITSYMVVSGIVPSILGGVADRVGRRPIYVFSFVVYLAANIGLALQHSWPALLILRMLQSVGSSGTIAFAYGVVADIAPPAERGSYVGAVWCGPNVAPSLGPVLGGAIAYRAGWQWIFWLLVILSGTCLALLALFLPESARSVVGNGRVAPRGIHRTLYSVLRRKRPRYSAERERRLTWKPRDLNFLVHFPLIFRKSTFPILWTNSVFYMIYCCVQASLSTAFITKYHYDELTAGLVYLPFGFGCALASYLSGKIMKRDYRITAEKNNLVIDRVKGDDLSHFPIEHARIRSIWYMIILTIAGVIGYGWALQAKTHIAVPLVMQFLIGTAATGIFNICGTFLIDLHPDSPSAVSALLNLLRCSLSASALAVLQIIEDHIGIGWCFTIFSAIALTTVPPLLVQRSYGMKWRLDKSHTDNPPKEEANPDVP